MTAVVSEAGPAGMLAGLRRAGYTVEQSGTFAVFDYMVEAGPRAGTTVRIGLELVSDWPLSAPHGPHISPRLGHPRGAVHNSPLGPEWEHWSRPPANWVQDRTIRCYLRHLRTLFAAGERALRVSTRFSVAMTSEVAQHLTGHLRRADGQEDCCFVLWRPSNGASRTTALLAEVVLPREGERIVHGTVDFTSTYFLRAAALAAEHGCGLGFIHAHPKGRGWQLLNAIDQAAEASFAAQTQVITGRPLVGLTFAGTDAAFSARIWQQQAPRCYTPTEAESVRVVGGRLTITVNDGLLPVPAATNRQLRTISAWGQTTQDDLARLHVGVVGCGSVGMLVVEALARTGIQRLSLFDFDTVEEINLDRLHEATIRDVRLHRAKAHLAARTARRAATSTNFRAAPYELSVVEPAGFAAAADCDVIFSCVDRPWPRAVLQAHDRGAGRPGLVLHRSIRVHRLCERRRPRSGAERRRE